MTYHLINAVIVINLLAVLYFLCRLDPAKDGIDRNSKADPK